MIDKAEIMRLSSKAQELKKIAQELHDQSEDFPAIQCNIKRILASVEMIRLNVEVGHD